MPRRCARVCILLSLALPLLVCGAAIAGAESAVDLTEARIIVRSGNLSAPERTAAEVLREEVFKRTGQDWPVSASWQAEGPLIVIGARDAGGRWARNLPRPLRGRGADPGPEGFSIHTDASDGRTVVWIVGSDGPGVLFGVGHFLRKLNWGPGRAALEAPLRLVTAPAYPIRGHQLGYRYHSNTYDAWSGAQYEQYVRELALFGANAIEQIAFQDDRVSPHFPMPRDEMNRHLSALCAKYGLQYWVWTPAEDLSDPEVYAAHVAEHEALYDDCPRLDAVFFPGGDPGSNPPELVMPFLADLAPRLQRRHPDALIWLSLQGFREPAVEYVFAYLDRERPDWFGGVVAGPGSPPIPETRARLHSDYGLRHYPDITHTVRCQYPTPWWDPALNVTLGREPTNPEPVRYALIHNWFAPYTTGSISYSDGVNDDVNKAVWSRRGWDPSESVIEILEDYTRLFFGPEVASEAAAGLLALERNWQGPLATNGGVDATLALWRALDARAPDLADNWRWLLCQFRAEFDAYTRARLLHEAAREQEAYALLEQHAKRDPGRAMALAAEALADGSGENFRPDAHAAIVALGDRLFETIGMQTSVKRHQASGTERGCVLDLIHYPLFNRWWIEDQFAEIAAMTSAAERTERLLLIARWENPGPGSFYDDIGNVGAMPRRILGEGLATDPLMRRNPNAGFMWWDGGFSRTRPSWQSYLSRTLGLRYDSLDPNAVYSLRATGFGEPIVRANGQALEAREPGRREIGEFMHFEVPPETYADGVLHVTWEQPDEAHLNWRQHSRLTEVWLLREE